MCARGRQCLAKWLSCWVERDQPEQVVKVVKVVTPVKVVKAVKGPEQAVRRVVAGVDAVVDANADVDADVEGSVSSAASASAGLYVSMDADMDFGFSGHSLTDLLKISVDNNAEGIRDVNTSAAYMSMAHMMHADVAHNHLGTMHRLNRAVHLLTVSPSLPQAMRRMVWMVSQFQMRSVLHTGYASRVCSAMCLVSGQHVVLKEYRLGSMSTLQRIHLFREITIHSRLQHRHIVQFHVAFLQDDVVYVVIERVRGMTLRSYLTFTAPGRMTEAHAVSAILEQLLLALVYLHDKGIIHRDIKPENIMIDMGQGASVLTRCSLVGAGGGLKLIDFGLATDLVSYVACTRAGTLLYMAPEMLACRTRTSEDVTGSGGSGGSGEGYTEMADVWAVGVLAYELLTGESPFYSGSDRGVVRRMINYNIQFPQSMSQPASEFIQRALAWHESDRPSVRALLQSAWMRAHASPKQRHRLKTAS